MENVTMSEQEMMEKGTLRSNKEVTQFLETVKDFVNQNFRSKGVVANVISQHEKEPYVNVSIYFATYNQFINLLLLLF